MAEAVGCEIDEDDLEATLTCLREQDASDITANEYNVADYTVAFYPFVPTVDGSFLPVSPTTMLSLDDVVNPDIPILIGTNANEGVWFLMYYLTDLMPNSELTADQRTLTQDEYMQTVSSIFTFYPENVRNYCSLGVIQLIDVK